ncbi:MAG: cytochrome c3 family protein [Pseudomonadota bacterium]
MEEVFASLKNGIHLLSRNRMPIFWILCSLILTLLFLYYFYIWPSRDMGPEQPIPFSHRVHAGVKQIQCEFCHPYVRRSSFPGIPPVEKCLYCHKYIIANHPEIKKEHGYFNTGTPTPWRKANYLPEHVFFNHQRHVKKDVACKECHGLVETMDRIKGVDFRMGFCINCHKEKKANLDCWLACHN